MKKFLLVSLVVLASIFAAQDKASARNLGGLVSSALAACPQGSAYADGCAAAPLTGQVKQSNFFTYARQSGQSAYAVRPPWNVACVDYGCGAYTDDAHLLDPVATGIPNCSYDSGNLYFRCNTAANIQHYKFVGVGLFFPSGTGTDLTLNDNHFTMTADNCQKYSGLGLVTGPSKGTLTATSNTFDFDPSCQINADLYKQASDPGLVTQSSGNATVNGFALVYTGTPTGTVRIGQYIDCPGCTEPAQITAGSGLNWTLGVSQASLGPFTVTTGPVKSRAAAAITGGGPATVTTLKYNADLGFADLGGMGFGDIDSQFNYVEAHGQFSQHVNMLQIQQNQAGTVNFIKQNFNVFLWSSNSYNSGTTSIGQFTTGPSNNTPIAPHGEVITTLSQMNNNVIITNQSAIAGQGTVTAAALRYLTQGSSAVTAAFTASQSGTTMTVTAFSSGAGALLPGQYVICTGCGVAGTNALKIVAQLTGATGDVGTYQLDRSLTLTSRAYATWLPGEITTLEQKTNYFDIAGTLSIFVDDINAVVNTLVRTGNINIQSGNACNSNGSCP